MQQTCNGVSVETERKVFSIPMLLLKLVSGMGLLMLTATVIDTLALYIRATRAGELPQVCLCHNEESEELKRLSLMKRRTDEDKLKQI